MATLHLTIPTDLEYELSKLQTDLESVVIKAIRQYIASYTSVANEREIESAAVQDNSGEFLTPTELRYYISLSDNETR